MTETKNNKRFSLPSALLAFILIAFLIWVFKIIFTILPIFCNRSFKHNLYLQDYNLGTEISSLNKFNHIDTNSKMRERKWRTVEYSKWTPRLGVYKQYETQSPQQSKYTPARNLEPGIYKIVLIKDITLPFTIIPITAWINYEVEVDTNNIERLITNRPIRIQASPYSIIASRVKPWDTYKEIIQDLNYAFNIHINPIPLEFLNMKFECSPIGIK